MSLNMKFERYKIVREIKRSGKYFDFYRPKVNEFGEPSSEYEKVISIKGLYHEFNPHQLDEYVYMTRSENGEVRSKKTPQILCLFEDVYFADLDNKNKYSHVRLGDVVYFGAESKMYKVTDMRNYQQIDIAFDISFEEVDGGE